MSRYYRTLLSLGSAVDNRFIMVVQSDNAGTSGNDQFTIPTTGAGYLYDIETSDGYTATGVTGNHTITFPSGAGTRRVRITGDFPRIFFNNVGDKLKVLEVTNWGTYGVSQANQTDAFRGCTNLTSIADNGAWFDVVTTGLRMFLNTSLTSLPSVMELPLLTIGTQMFQNNSLTSLPAGMELPLLDNGTLMFINNPLTSLPAGMELPLLTNGSSMFRNNSLTSLPSGMELPLLTIGTQMFLGNTINTTRYSQLLVNLESGNANNSVTFHGGNSKYNVIGETARNILTASPRLWTITDGGLEFFPTTGLFAYYKLDDTTGAVIDSLGSNNGTNVGATRGVAGKIGDAFSFDGTNDYVDLNDVSLNTQNAYSLGCWFKTTGTSVQQLLTRDGLSPNRFWQFRLDVDGKVRLIRFNSSNSVLANFTTPLSYNDGNWHLAIATFSTTNGSKIYVDGTQVASDTVLTQNRTGSGEKILLAADRSSNPRNFLNGQLDEAFIFENHELLAADVTTIWSGGAGITL